MKNKRWEIIWLLPAAIISLPFWGGGYISDILFPNSEKNGRAWLLSKIFPFVFMITMVSVYTFLIMLVVNRVRTE
jgi:hypothetical protein